MGEVRSGLLRLCLSVTTRWVLGTQPGVAGPSSKLFSPRSQGGELATGDPRQPGLIIDAPSFRGVRSYRASSFFLGRDSG